MTKRLNWQRAHLASKSSISIADEADYMANNSASRFLQHKEALQQRETTKGLE